MGAQNGFVPVVFPERKWGDLFETCYAIALRICPRCSSGFPPGKTPWTFPWMHRGSDREMSVTNAHEKAAKTIVDKTVNHDPGKRKCPWCPGRETTEKLAV